MVVFDEIRLNPNDSCGENGVLTTGKNTYKVEMNKDIDNGRHQISV